MPLTMPAYTFRHDRIWTAVPRKGETLRDGDGCLDHSLIACRLGADRADAGARDLPSAADPGRHLVRCSTRQHPERCTA